MRFGLVGLVLIVSSAVQAQTMDHMHAHQKTDESTSTHAYRADMAKMHEGMDIEYTGNADLDFVNGMIPHHEGAIDMAKTQLKYGKDERLRRMAKSIIAAQTKEVRFMRDWRNNTLAAPYQQAPINAKQ